MSTSELKNSDGRLTLYPLLYLAICFAIGIFLASLIGGSWIAYLFAALVLSSVALIYRETKYTTLFVLAAFISIGGFYFVIHNAAQPKNSIKVIYESGVINSGDPVEVEGILSREPEPSIDGYFLLLMAEKIVYKGKPLSISGGIRLFVPIWNAPAKAESERLNLHYGNRLRIAVNLQREERFLNPGGISLKQISDQKGIHANGLVKSHLLIEKLKNTNGFDPLIPIYKLRQNLIKETKKQFDASTAGILIASIFGNRHHLSRESSELFRDGGTFHILVISGLHITFIGGLLLLLVRTFTRNRLLQFAITSVGLWGYSLAVGAEIPVVRAALMFTILLFSFVIYRSSTLLNALGACGLAILVWRPEDLFSQSFHLTFLSLFGIIGFAFPFIEKLHSIGSWMPTSSEPFPPKVSKQLKGLCEALYWNEAKWRKTLSENVWDCRIFKTSHGEWFSGRWFQKPLRWGFEGILITLFVQIFLLPFLVAYFHRVSFASLILNLWVGIFIVLQNITAIIAMLFSGISENLALPLIKLAEVFNWILLLLPKLFVENDLASIRVPIYSGWMKGIYVLYFVPLIFLTLAINRWSPFSSGRLSKGKDSKNFLRRYFFLGAVILFATLFSLIVFHPYSAPSLNGKLELSFLDVGQGDSIFIRFPNGETMLVDGGGKRRFDRSAGSLGNEKESSFEPDRQRIGETVVSEFLWEKGYSKVDYILATHADSDHMQGLTDVAKNFGVRYAFVGEDVPLDEDYVEFTEMLQRKKISRIQLFRGNSFEIGGVKIEILNSGPDKKTSGNSPNNNSVVLRLTFGVKKFLLTGDIEKKTEEMLLDRVPLLKADVVKVAHHGSRTSSTKAFVEAAKAEYAIIPVGKRSRFGHPHKEVVNRWTKSGAKVLKTGERGTITVSTDGKNLEIQTFLKRRSR